MDRMRLTGQNYKRRKQTQGMTRLEVVALLVTLCVLAIFILSALQPKRSRAARIKCVSNLKNIALAHRMWAAEHNDQMP
jgi:hypothetical protein